MWFLSIRFKDFTVLTADNHLEKPVKYSRAPIPDVPIKRFLGEQ